MMGMRPNWSLAWRVPLAMVCMWWFLEYVYCTGEAEDD